MDFVALNGAAATAAAMSVPRGSGGPVDDGGNHGEFELRLARRGASQCRAPIETSHRGSLPYTSRMLHVSDVRDVDRSRRGSGSATTANTRDSKAAAWEQQQIVSPRPPSGPPVDRKFTGISPLSLNDGSDLKKELYPPTSKQAYEPTGDSGKTQDRLKTGFFQIVNPSALLSWPPSGGGLIFIVISLLWFLAVLVIALTVLLHHQSSNRSMLSANSAAVEPLASISPEYRTTTRGAAMNRPSVVSQPAQLSPNWFEDEGTPVHGELYQRFGLLPLMPFLSLKKYKQIRSVTIPITTDQTIQRLYFIEMVERQLEMNDVSPSSAELEFLDALENEPYNPPLQGRGAIPTRVLQSQRMERSKREKRNTATKKRNSKRGLVFKEDSSEPQAPIVLKTTVYLSMGHCLELSTHPYGGRLLDADKSILREFNFKPYLRLLRKLLHSDADEPSGFPQEFFMMLSQLGLFQQIDPQENPNDTVASQAIKPQTVNNDTITPPDILASGDKS